MGSNRGSRIAHLQFGLERLSAKGQIGAVSSVYETEPWGVEDQPLFLNAVCSLRTQIDDPLQLLDILKSIEVSSGRSKDHQHLEARTLDLDILFWGSDIIESDRLTIPHPLLPERRFVLLPLAEINPDLCHPVSGLTVSEILEQCSDTHSAAKVGKLSSY